MTDREKLALVEARGACVLEEAFRVGLAEIGRAEKAERERDDFSDTLEALVTAATGCDLTTEAGRNAALVMLDRAGPKPSYLVRQLRQERDVLLAEVRAARQILAWMLEIQDPERFRKGSEIVAYRDAVAATDAVMEVAGG